MTAQVKMVATLKEGRKNLTKIAKKVNTQAIEMADVMIEETVKSGSKYQRIVAKAIKNSEPIFAKNVDIMFDTVEALNKQYTQGSKRFQKLLGITKQVKQVKKTINKTWTSANSTFDKSFKTIKDNVEDVAEGIEKKSNKYIRKAKKATKK